MVVEAEVSIAGGGRALGTRPGPRPGWRQRGEHLGLLLRLAVVLTSAMPTSVRYALADIGGDGAHRLLRRRARVARENYLPFTRGEREAERLTRRAFRNYARTVMDFLVLERLVEETKAHPELVETGPLRAALASGRSAIVVTPHFGNWDLGAAMTATCSRPVFAVADQFGPPAVDSQVRATRERVGVSVIPTGPSSAREALRVLRRGDVLCLAADIDKAGSGVAVRFLGRLVSLPGGPATLALRTDSPIIPGYVRRLKGGGHEARLLDPLPFPPPGRQEERVGLLTQRIAEAFEVMIRRDPDQWFAFHRLVERATGGTAK